METVHLRDELRLYLMLAGIELEQGKDIVNKTDDVSRLPVHRQFQGLYLPELKQLTYHMLDTDHILADKFHVIAVRGILRDKALQLF